MSVDGSKKNSSCQLSISHNICINGKLHVFSHLILRYPFVVVIKVLSQFLSFYGVTMMCIGLLINRLTANSVITILVLHLSLLMALVTPNSPPVASRVESQTGANDCFAAKF